MAPIIGFTLDYEEKPTYSKLPWYALRENYCASVSRFGAVPIGLPHEVEQVEQYLDMIDGLIVTGGAFDVSPELYGETTRSDTVTTKKRRTQFEYAITQGVMKRNIPILGICGGEQLLNVVLGGTLIQHIPDTIPNALEHEQKNPRNEPGHEVTVVPGTLLHAILSGKYPHPGPLPGRERGKKGERPLSAPSPSQGEGRGEGPLTIAVNSAHHQAIAKPAPGCIVNASAPDGVIEGIEYPDHPFCLGVQWHPEYFVTDADEKIMRAFVDAASRRMTDNG